MASDPNKYFAAENSKDLAGSVMKKCDDYYKFVLESGLITLWRRSYNAYYRGVETLGSMMKFGNQAEYTKLYVNHYKNLVDHMVTMTTGKRPSWDPRAINTDLESLEQCLLGKGLLDYYMKEKHLDERHKEQAIDAVLFGEGYIAREWDTELGDEYAVDPVSKKAIRNGDIKYTNFTPMDVARDVYKDSAYEDDWKIIRPFQNKFNLAAKYPELRDKILSVPTKSEDMRYTRFFMDYDANSDDIPVYYFYHEKTAALPNGRLHISLNDEIVLFDGPLPYEKIPITRMAAGNLKGTPFGYSRAFDFLSIQQAINNLYSIILTNNMAFGIQCIATPKGGGIAQSNLAEGLILLEYDAALGKPESLQLTSSSPETYQFLQILEQVMETLSGINSVARGNPEASLKSGAALALVQSMAIQFNADLDQSYIFALEDNGTGTLSMLRDFATVPRVAAIVGKFNKPYLKSFVGAKLNKISRVVVDAGSPLMKTTAGKVEMADKLLAAGFIDDPYQYLTVINTGNFETAIENEQRELMLIRSENEGLSDGVPAIAVKTDRHDLHILEHASVLSSSEARQNAKVVQATLDHIDEHLLLYQQISDLEPALANILKMNPIGAAPQADMQASNPMAEPGLPQPNFPQNPLTGATWNPDTGGLPPQAG